MLRCPPRKATATCVWASGHRRGQRSAWASTFSTGW